MGKSGREDCALVRASRWFDGYGVPQASSSGVLNAGRKGSGSGTAISVNVKVSNHFATKDGPNYMRTQHDFEVRTARRNHRLEPKGTFRLGRKMKMTHSLFLSGRSRSRDPRDID